MKEVAISTDKYVADKRSVVMSFAVMIKCCATANR